MSGNFWASSCLAMPWSLIIFCQAVGLLFYDEVRVVEVPQVADSSTKSTHPRPSNPLPRQHKMPCHPLRCHVLACFPWEPLVEQMVGLSQRLRVQNFECSIAETNQFQVILCLLGFETHRNFINSWLLGHPFGPREVSGRGKLQVEWGAGNKTWAQQFHSLWRFVCWEQVVKTVLTDPTTQAGLVS